MYFYLIYKINFVYFLKASKSLVLIINNKHFSWMFTSTFYNAWSSNLKTWFYVESVPGKFVLQLDYYFWRTFAPQLWIFFHSYL